MAPKSTDCKRSQPHTSTGVNRVRTLRYVVLLVHGQGQRQGDGPAQPAPRQERRLPPVDACRINRCVGL